MRFSSPFVVSLLLTTIFSAAPAEAKESVLATVSTATIEGTRIDVGWSLADEKSGKPFSACAVFIRLIGPTGEPSEAFAEDGQKSAEGHYDATAIVPSAGVTKIEIGVAGTMTDREGTSDRSDWLIRLANDPLQTR